MPASIIGLIFLSGVVWLSFGTTYRSNPQRSSGLDEFFSDCLTSEYVTDMLFSLNFLILKDETDMSSRNVGNQLPLGAPQLNRVWLVTRDTKSQ
jgi:hypothetical protein